MTGDTDGVSSASARSLPATSRESAHSRPVASRESTSSQSRPVASQKSAQSRPIASPKSAKSRPVTSQGSSQSRAATSRETRDDVDRSARERMERHEHEQIFGRRLSDDALDVFCDRLVQSCPSKLEGGLAMQFLLVDPANVKPMISGKKRVIQILYDSTREHYVTVYYSPRRRELLLYDSLVDKEDPKRSLGTEIVQQILTLFGHVHRGEIFVQVPTDIDTQNDSWSCGYRCLGFCVDLARRKDPRMSLYDLRQLHSMLLEVLSSKIKVPWPVFSEKRAYRKRVRREEEKHDDDRDDYEEMFVVDRDARVHSKEDYDRERPVTESMKGMRLS